MKSGIELIAAERQDQIVKHNRSIESDVKYNDGYELCKGACALLTSPDQEGDASDIVWLLALKDKWDKVIYDKMVSKPYKERLIIAGALIAAELDRLQAIDSATLLDTPIK